MFYVAVAEDLNVFQYLNEFCKKLKPFLKKLYYRFAVKGTTTENATFPYKTALSTANVKTK